MLCKDKLENSFSCYYGKWGIDTQVQIQDEPTRRDFWVLRLFCVDAAKRAREWGHPRESWGFHLCNSMLLPPTAKILLYLKKGTATFIVPPAEQIEALL